MRSISMTVPFGCRSAARRRRCESHGPVEALEARVLLSAEGMHDLELIGRASDGTWWAGGYTLGDPQGMQNEVFSAWNPAVDWHDVRVGDFDGDGLSDLAGRDPASGNWWTSLSDMVGATVKLAGNWAASSSWLDVAAVDLAAAGDRGDLGHFTNKTDLVGRDHEGTWWAAVSNGDGTFTNVSIAHWNPTAGWRDVRFFDVNGDDTVDIVGRTADGTWFAAVSQGGLAYESVFLAGWNETAGWRDVRVLDGFLADGEPALAGRDAAGNWWIMEFPSGGAAFTTRAFGWNEAALWRDVLAADLDGDGRDELVGRTVGGAWWSTEVTAGGVFVTAHLGTWNEAADWRDVQAVAVAGVGDVLVGRTLGGAWWMSQLDGSAAELAHTAFGSWNEAAAWRDVHSGHFTRDPLAFTRVVGTGVNGEGGTIDIDIQGHRLGTTVTIDNAVWSTSVQPGSFALIVHGLIVKLDVAATGYSREWRIVGATGLGNPDENTWTVVFDGHYGADSFTSVKTFQDAQVAAPKPAVARGWAGDDQLDGRNNDAIDSLFGDDGIDVLFGDPGDVLVQD